jgi:hypothetical protein
MKQPHHAWIEGEESDGKEAPRSHVPEADRRHPSLGALQVSLQNLFSVHSALDRRATVSFNHTLNQVMSAIWFLLSAIGATPLSLRTLALFADAYLKDLCWSFGFQESITQALYISLVITSGSAGVFLAGVAVFLVFSCVAGICGLVSLLGGLLWGISVGGAGGTAVMGVSVVAPTFLLSILGAALIGLVGTVSKHGTHRRLGPPAPPSAASARERARHPRHVPLLPPSSTAKPPHASTAGAPAPRLARPTPEAPARASDLSDTSTPVAARGTRAPASAEQRPARPITNHHRTDPSGGPTASRPPAHDAAAVAPRPRDKAGGRGDSASGPLQYPTREASESFPPAAAAAAAAAATATPESSRCSSPAADMPEAASSPYGTGPARRRGRGPGAAEAARVPPLWRGPAAGAVRPASARTGGGGGAAAAASAAALPLSARAREALAGGRAVLL